MFYYNLLYRCSEYIIDMMGAPGTLIPAEVPSSQIQNYGFAGRDCAEIVGQPNNTNSIPDDGTDVLRVFSDCTVGSIQTKELLDIGSQTKPDEINHVKVNDTGRYDHTEACECSSHSESSQAEKMHVKNVSQYVLSAAKNPDFASKLQTILLESGASPPSDLFSDMNPRDRGVYKINDKIVIDTVQADPNRLLLNYGKSLIAPQGVGCGSDTMLCQSADQLAEQQKELYTDATEFYDSSQCGNTRSEFATVSSNIEAGKDSAIQIDETVDEDGILYDNKSKESNSVIGEGTDWEVQWEDLCIGERIGIGKYIPGL